MTTIWQRSRDAAEALSRLGTSGAEALLRAFVQQTEAAATRAEEALDELLTRTEMTRAQLAEEVRDETRATVEALGLASRDDLGHVRGRLERLEEQVRELAGEGQE